MSLISFKESLIANVPTPEPGRYIYFIDSVSKQLYSKNNAGVVSPVGGFTDTFQLYSATHAPSGSISVYTLDLTGKPAPVVGKQINIKLSAANTFGSIQVSIPSLGTFNLFKVGGVGFAAGELKAGQVISIIIDSGTAYYLSGFVQTGIVHVADTAALKALISASSLTVGTVYQFAFNTQYTLNGVTVTAPSSEILFVRATATNSVASAATSAAYPQDIIDFDISDATYGSKIKRRRDPITGLEAPFDWRNVKFRRGKDAVSGKYLEFNPAAATFSSDFQDVFCFDNSQNGGGCRAIKIDSQHYNASIAPILAYNNWGIIDTNIVFSGPCRNIHVKAGCFSMSFYSLGTTPAQDPATGHALGVEATSESLIGQVTRGSITASKNVIIRGALVASNEFYNVNYIKVDNSDSVYIDGASTKIAVESCTNVYIGPGCTSIAIEESNNVWITGAQRTNLYGCKDSAFKNTVDSTYSQVSSFFALGSLQERINASRNLTSFNVSGSSIESLKDAYQYRDKTCNVVAVQAGTPQIVVASIASASFVEGDMVQVNNSIALLSKATAIAFDTNADNLPDTASYALVVADFQQFYPTNLATVAGNFYLLYSNNKFHLLFSVINCPFKLDTNNSQFDGLTSNIQRTLNYGAGAVVLSNSTDYDFGPVGVLKISHAGANDALSQIVHATQSYPKLKRELRNNNAGNVITLSHGIGSNLIALPGALQRQLNNLLDLAEIDLDSSNQWKVIKTSTNDDGSYSQRVSLSLTAAQLKTLNTTPILAAPAPGNNKMVRLLNAVLVFRTGATAYGFASNFYFRINGVRVSSQVSSITTLDTLISKVLVFEPVSDGFDIITINNNPLQFYAEANSALGDGTATLVLNYRIIDLP